MKKKHNKQRKPHEGGFTARALARAGYVSYYTTELPKTQPLQQIFLCSANKRFHARRDANMALTRERRKGFVVPEKA